MAKGSTRVSLTTSRAEAEGILNDVIERGQNLLDQASSVRDEAGFTEWAAEQTAWRKYVVAALQSISEGDSLEQEFTQAGSRGAFVIGGPPPSVGEKLEERTELLVSQVNTLRSAVERLPLFSA